MKQVQPFVEAPLVEQFGLGAEEALDFGLQQQRVQRARAIDRRHGALAMSRAQWA